MSKERALDEAIRQTMLQTDLAVRLHLSARASSEYGQDIIELIDTIIAALIELKCALRKRGDGPIGEKA